mgnify:CR=1 FL=1
MTTRTRGIIASIVCCLAVAVAVAAYAQFGTKFILWHLVMGEETKIEEKKPIKLQFTSSDKERRKSRSQNTAAEKPRDTKLAIIECLIATSLDNLYYCALLLVLIYHVLGIACFEILNFIDLTLGRSMTKRSGPLGIEDLVLCMLIWPAYGPLNLLGSLVSLAL